MTPEQMRLRAVQALAEEFDRSHADPQGDAHAFVGRMMRAGWRPNPELLDTGGPRRTEPSPRASEHIDRIRRTLAERKAARR